MIVSQRARKKRECGGALPRAPQCAGASSAVDKRVNSHHEGRCGWLLFAVRVSPHEH